MPIDPSVRNSPGFWLNRLAPRLLDPRRQNRFNTLDGWYVGNAPLPVGADTSREAFQQFQKYARANHAEIIVNAPLERMHVVGIRTQVDADETGDAEAWRLWRRAGLEVESIEVHRSMFTMGEAYVIVGGPDEDGVPIITAEDPRQVITEHDPRRPRVPRAALKMFIDDINDVYAAYLYLPGAVYVATKPIVMQPTGVTRFDDIHAWNIREWDWEPELSGPIPAGLMPVVRFFNARGVGEFEPHIDTMARINHMLLQRMVIATLQAFRQRAVKGLPATIDGRPLKEDLSNLADFTDIFTASPGSLWQVPDGVEFWESGVVDLTPILTSVRHDVMDLAADSRTPFYMFGSGGDNVSATSSDVARESLTFKTEDRIARCSGPWALVQSAAFRWLGDDARADLANLEVLWRPAERLTLAERHDASLKAKADGVPFRTRMRTILQFTPQQVDEMESEKAADLLLGSLADVAASPAPRGAAASAAPARPGAVLAQPPAAAAEPVAQ